MRYLVTGTTGFIGTHLCRRLLAEGHEVVGLVRSPHKLAPDLRGRIEVLQGDLSIFDHPARRLPRADVVVHLAAVVAGDDQAHYGEVNYRAVERLVRTLAAQDWTPRRLLFASSLAAAGPSRGRPLTEDDAPAPVDAYGRAKLAAEQLMAEQPYPTTIFRPSVVLGAGDSASLTLFRMARLGVTFVPGLRPQRLSVIDVHELVDAILVMAEADAPRHQRYFATGAAQTTNGELLRAMAHAQGRRLLVLRVPKLFVFVAMIFSTLFAKLLRHRNQLDLKQYQQMTAPEFVCSSGRLQALGWTPKKTLEQTLRDAVAGYRTSGHLPDDGVPARPLPSA